MPDASFTLINKLGLHARAAAKLVAVTTQFEASIELTCPEKNKQADGKSIMAILMLGATVGNTLQVRAQGHDAQEAVTAIGQLIARRFDEPE